MDSADYIYARSPSNLFRRCVVNCPTKPPDCPVCSDGQTCSITSQSCDKCPASTCIDLSGGSSSSSSSSSSSGTNVGAIVGGVVGGIAVIVILFALWWFCIRNKRKNAQQEWDANGVEKRNTYAAGRGPRQSTAGSIASTVLTRASNVIQIAYIPGVTNRSPPNTPQTLVPPVPPIPAAMSGNSSFTQDQHYFMPGDIRDSVWSGMSEDDRKSISPSLARSSVATTIYRNNAIVSPVPAQQALRGKAAVVSVKSGTSTPTTAPGTPAMPAISQSQLEKANALAAAHNAARGEKVVPNSIVARSVVARPVNVKNSSRKPPKTIRESDERSVMTAPSIKLHAPPNSEVQSLASFDEGDERFDIDSEEEDTQHPNSPTSAQPGRNSMPITVIEDSPEVKQSPFADPDTASKHSGHSSHISSQYAHSSSRNVHGGSGHRHRSSQDSKDTDKTNRNGKKGGASTARSMSPFSDEREVEQTHK